MSYKNPDGHLVFSILVNNKKLQNIFLFSLKQKNKPVSSTLLNRKIIEACNYLSKEIAHKV